MAFNSLKMLIDPTICYSRKRVLHVVYTSEDDNDKAKKTFDNLQKLRAQHTLNLTHNKSDSYSR